MPIKTVLILAAIFLTATVVLYLSGATRDSRKTRVFVVQIPNQPEEQIAQITKYLREACPDMVLIKDRQRADYRLNVLWMGTPRQDSLSGWVVIVSRRDLERFFHREGSPDAIETFRQSCAAIRDDAKELTDFESHTPPTPIGRYSLLSVNPDRVFLLDTKTGAVWELKPFGDTQEFESISVQGLYINKPF